ncbi:BTB/POZ domain-containing protein npy2 [Phtheirospermum japonicum]|uniref:BTB/POZ domain-containing protein npy2 n=1 Tax=Phtheirospermum japonicum TaxID=374723 RepID=A0A830CMY4_9LAMI|nr:BTB/POZ domain-containing protein npy2 [Phtheirospermum japonicum]
MKFMKLGTKPDCFKTDGNIIRYAASDLPTDIVVHVADVKFHLHKFPLLARSARLKKLVSSANEVNVEEVHLHDIPGGPTAFETCAKFCYDTAVNLNAYNVISARCAAEYLEMHETVEKGNLVYKIDVFLSSCVFRSWKDSIIALQETRTYLPLSEELNLIGRSVDAIAYMASVDTSNVDWSYTYNRKKQLDENALRTRTVPNDWWADDLSELEIDLYERVIVAIKNEGLISNDVIGEALKAYAYRKLPSSSKGVNIIIQRDDVFKFQSTLDTIVRLLPAGRGVVSCSFLLKLLRAGISLNSGEVLKTELVKRIGQQLEEARVDDLLIQSCGGEKMMYDVITVQEIIEQFKKTPEMEHGEIQEIRASPGILSEASKLMVAKLIDGYLAEVAKDPNLPLSMFVGTAEMVSGFTRPGHDGLYRAIDTYLKNHPAIGKFDRKKICRLMDCKKLSVDACMHAVQNERLPLRVVVQVLFFEQTRASALSGCSTPDLPKPIKDLRSYGSSRSANTTNNTDDEDWDAMASADELRALRRELAALKLGNSGENRINGRDKTTFGKTKSLVTTKRIFSKIWSRKEVAQTAENSGSDSCDDDAECGPTRRGRHSVS